MGGSALLNSRGVPITQTCSIPWALPDWAAPQISHYHSSTPETKDLVWEPQIIPLLCQTSLVQGLLHSPEPHLAPVSASGSLPLLTDLQCWLTLVFFICFLIEGILQHHFPRFIFPTSDNVWNMPKWDTVFTHGALSSLSVTLVESSCKIPAFQ